MKHFFSFPGVLLPFRKLHYPYNSSEHKPAFKALVKSNPFFIGLFALWFFVWLMIPVQGRSQEVTPIRQGDKVPAVVLENIINYPVSTTNILKLRGKLLILDFWESWCKGCLVLMPKVRALQKAYGDRIQILAVSAQQAGAIANIARVNEQVRENPIPMVTGDRKLAAMFPHKLVPHIVWILSDGTYLGSTDQSELSAVNIDRILSTGKAPFAEFKIDLMNFNADKPMFSDSTGFGSDFIFKSAITPYQHGVPGQSGLDNSGKQLRMYGINTDLFRLYCLSLHVASEHFAPNRVIYADTALRRRFRYDSKLKNRESIYCYELIVPAIRKDILRPLMRSELMQATGIDVSVQTQKVPCYVLRIAGKLHRNTPGRTPVEATHFRWTSELTDYLNSLPGMPPIIDETGGDVRLNEAVPFSGYSLAALNEKLSALNLVLVQEQRNLDMLFVDTIHTPSPQLTE